MMKAENTRIIQAKANEKRNAVRLAKHHKYVSKLIEKKINPEACKGARRTIFKLSRWASRILVVDILCAEGYEVITEKNNRVITVKW